jgi:hypothetical protein
VFWHGEDFDGQGGKVALGAGQTSRLLPEATVAELWLTPCENTCQNRTNQTGHLDLSPSFYNKIGKMEIRPEFFESAASASSAIPAEVASD